MEQKQHRTYHLTNIVSGYALGKVDTAQMQKEKNHC